MSLDADVRARVGTLDLDLKLSAASDEIVAILGPNGAGKTTILRILAGLRALDAGRVELDGVVLDDPSDHAFIVPERRPIGVVFQDYLLFPFLSARDNVAFGLRRRGSNKADARREAGVWLERVGLGESAELKPDELSGGQAQRVALARALATKPALLLLDEPLAALDATARGEIRRELRRHLASFAGVRVLVTHDPIDAATLADRLVVLEDGRISQVGTYEQISAHPRSRYVADLVGLNLFRGTARAGRVTLDRGQAELTISDGSVAGEIFAVVHPRAVSVHIREPEGSPRNRWAGTIIDLEHRADRVRAHIDAPIPIVAEITQTAVDELGLQVGSRVWTAVKATEIDAYPV